MVTPTNSPFIMLRIAIAVISACSVSAFSPSPMIIPTVRNAIYYSNGRTFTSTELSAASASAAVPIAPVPPTYSALFGLSLKRSITEQKPLFAIPSIFNSDDSRPVVLFDGKCNLCNAGVQLILDTDRADKDPRGNLRVAALQSRVGKVLLARLPTAQRETVLSITSGGGEDKAYKSIVVAGKDRTWLNSAACLRIGRELKGPLRYLALFASVFPAFIRDPMYKLLSRYRKKLFGESPECRLWDDNWDTRFIDDVLFGGREPDPFADPNAPVEEDDDEDSEDAPPGSPLLYEGDTVRVVSSSNPILHTHVSGYEGDGGICSVGMVGTVMRVLKRQAYPKNVVVKFLMGGDGENAPTSFEGHFSPGQLKKE